MNRSRYAIPYWAYGLLMLAFAYMLYNVWYSNHNISHINTAHIQQIVHIESFSQDLISAHLWLAKYMAPPHDPNSLKIYRSMWKKAGIHLEKLRELVRVHEPGTTIPQDIRKVNEHLQMVDQLARTRIANPQKGGVNSPLDDEYDQQLDVVLNIAANVENSIVQSTSRHIVKFHHNREFLLLTAVMGMLLALFFLWILDRNRKRSAEAALEAERQQHQNAEFLRAFYNATPDMIFVHDKNGQILDVSDTVVTRYGCPKEELVQWKLGQLMGKDCDTEEAKGRYMQAVAGEAVDFECVACTADGEEFPVEVRLRPLPEIEGEKARVVAYVRDISERMQRNEELLRLRVAIDQIPDALFITDREGHIVYANPACEQLYGLTLDSMLGEYAARLRGGDVDDDLYRDIRARLNSGAVWKDQLQMNISNRSHTVRRIVSPVSNGHKVIYHVYMDHDITEERIQQEKMEHTQRLESLGVLAGGIAHDFNNILTAIMGNAALGRMKMKDADPALVHLARIEESSQRAAELCKQMLAYSGKGRFVVKAINLSDMAEDITKLLGISIAKNVVLKFHLAENLPAVEADIAQLQQVVMNLVINASDAIGSRSGVISLSTGMMQADAGYLLGAYAADDIEPGHFVFLEVADTGCGMDEETQKKLFDPFFTTKFTGRGLGMSAVLGIVRGHHGAIKVYSEAGQGTTFKVLLPASIAKVSEQAESEAWGDWCGIGTVLVVDDEGTIRETAAMMLRDMGFDTLTAEDGEQGVEVYRKHQDKIVAVVLDMTMPKLDGKGCFTELRRINKNVRVVLSSGYNEQDTTNRFAGQGLAGFIQKPYPPEALRAKMKEVLERDAS
ncbi:MAG: PAS domain S-box protein [Mariprofundaceae bacterium]|nr:PAS domain S-box protein [Mariprofundaceae bacterium]